MRVRHAWNAWYKEKERWLKTLQPMRERLKYKVNKIGLVSPGIHVLKKRFTRRSTIDYCELRWLLLLYYLAFLLHLSTKIWFLKFEIFRIERALYKMRLLMMNDVEINQPFLVESNLARSFLLIHTETEWSINLWTMNRSVEWLTNIKTVHSQIFSHLDQVWNSSKSSIGFINWKRFQTERFWLSRSTRICDFWWNWCLYWSWRESVGSVANLST